MYYIEQQKKLKKNLKRFALLLSDDLESRFGTEKTKQILQETQDEFDILILQIPYIGGKSNPLTRNLIEAGYSLAFYRALKKQGVSLEEAGELIHLGTTYKLNKIPAFMRQLLGRWKLAKWQIPKLKKLAEISRERRYPEDWVFEMIEGDGQSFDIGRNYLECGIEKFIAQTGS